MMRLIVERISSIEGSGGVLLSDIGPIRCGAWYRLT
jgi:hypothetical protein